MMTWKSRRWLWLLCLLPVLAGLARLRFDVDVLNLLPADVPAVRGLRLYQQHFAHAHELIITVRGAESETVEASARTLAETLRRQKSLVRDVAWQPPWLERPVEMAELVAFLWFNQPPEVFRQMAQRLAPDQRDATLSATRERLATTFSPGDLARLAYDPYDLLHLPEGASGGAPGLEQGQEMFASPDGAFRLIFVHARGELASYRECIAWLQKIKETVAQWRKTSGSGNVEIQYTGRPAFEAEIAGGMEGDMTASVGITSLIIACLFWLAHRRWIPMIWLLVLLGLILAGTLALGGLLYGAVNVVSLGFAGILLGLAVDYGVVHYQEAIASPQAIIPEIRRAIGPSIFWAAVTTISAFLVLNFSGLPGLAQLGTLVAVGVGLSALVMLFAYLPPLFRDRMKKRLAQIAAGTYAEPVGAAHDAPREPPPRGRVKGVQALTAFLLLTATVILLRGVPPLDHTPEALRPQHSAAYAALDEIKVRLAQGREPLWVLITGFDESQVARQLERATPLLQRAVSNGVLASFTLATPLWPQPDFQASNRVVAASLVTQRESLRASALAAGFSRDSFVMTENILHTWQAASTRPNVFWPTNDTSRWIIEKIVARRPDELLALGLVFPATHLPVTGPAVRHWTHEMAGEGFIVSGWDLLGTSILERVKGNLWRVVLPMVLLVLLSLWLAFRRPLEILLSLAVLMMSGLCLLAVMRVAGWSWNLLNLMALPLMLGSGVDYSIFMQLALRRHRGDVVGAHRSVGRALLLCGGTAVAGFGSLSWSTNAGMASLGQVCAVGIGCNMLISVYLLPVWWRRFTGAGEVQSPTSQSPKSDTAGQPAGPSSLYRATFWKVGLMAALRLPESWSLALARKLGWVYWFLARHRREVVVQNLLPPLQGDPAAAERVARELFAQFAVKLVDLWRYESGLPVDRLFAELTGWEHFTSAYRRGGGVLLVTPHLGNWEFGGPLLIQRGIKLHVITLIEPGTGLTELRLASRARWGIETLVIGEDAFAVVEVIKRLEAGATVALLIDRPPAASAATVELFGRPFQASIAAAELARASGCALVPVVLPRRGRSYAAHVLPEINYDRAALAKREARQELTQKILRAFEPAIREHLDQWYHFVPIWPDKR